MQETSNVKSMSLFDALSAIRPQKEEFSTGAHELDRVLGSQAKGIQRGTVIEVCGPPGSGKTIIGLCLALDAIKNSATKVLWVSTNCQPFALERMTQLAGFEDEFVQSIRLCDTRALSHLMLLMSQLIETEARYGLVVIEDMLFQLSEAHGLSSASSEDRKRVLCALLSKTKAVAEKTGSAIICMSSMLPTFRRGVDDVQTLVPGLGYGTWTRVFTSRITLYRDGNGGRWARSLDGREIPFHITASGIADGHLISTPRPLIMPESPQTTKSTLAHQDPTQDQATEAIGQSTIELVEGAPSDDNSECLFSIQGEPQEEPSSDDLDQTTDDVTPSEREHREEQRPSAKITGRSSRSQPLEMGASEFGTGGPFSATRRPETQDLSISPFEIPDSQGCYDEDDELLLEVSNGSICPVMDHGELEQLDTLAVQQTPARQLQSNQPNSVPNMAH
jgi:hypothetical protein